MPDAEDSASERNSVSSDGGIEAITYLIANFLDQVWGRACGRLKSTNVDVHVGISEQDCRHFGCIYHRE